MLLVPPARYIPEGMHLAVAPKIKSRSFRQIVKLISLQLLTKMPASNPGSAGKTTAAFEKASLFFPKPHLCPRKTFMPFIRLRCKRINGYKKFEGQEVGSGEKPWKLCKVSGVSPQVRDMRLPSTNSRMWIWLFSDRQDRVGHYSARNQLIILDHLLLELSRSCP